MSLPRVVLRDPDDDLADVLQEGQFLVLKHPIAAQAAFAALVAEGRRFATTPEGRRWLAALVDSDLIRRGRVLWEGSALNMLQESSEATLPSALLDAIVGATARGDLGALLERMFDDAGAGAA